jgi:hypothetical protein
MGTCWVRISSAYLLVLLAAPQSRLGQEGLPELLSA